MWSFFLPVIIGILRWQILPVIVAFYFEVAREWHVGILGIKKGLD